MGDEGVVGDEGEVVGEGALILSVTVTGGEPGWRGITVPWREVVGSPSNSASLLGWKVEVVPSGPRTSCPTIFLSG